MYELGKVVRCRVIGTETTPQGQRRLKLSLSSKVKEDAGANAASEAAAAALASFSEGQVVGSATVSEVVEAGNSFRLTIEADGASVNGLLEAAHLSDHAAAVSALQSVIKASAVLPHRG